MKVQTRESAIQNSKSPCQARIPGIQPLKLKRNGIPKFSAIDMLNIRDSIENTGKEKKGVDVSALYIPQDKRKMQNVSQKKKDEDAAEQERKRKADEAAIQKALEWAKR